MTALAARPGRCGQDAEAIAAAACPADPGELIAAALYVLPLAMVCRGDVYHLRRCRNSHVNSRPFACSDDCVRAQVALVWLVTWREQYGARPAQQASLFDEAAG